jgi:two-component system response regulator DegU
MNNGNEQMKILIVDDHEVVRRGVRLMAETIDSAEVIGEASNGAEAIAFCGAHRPDAVLMDVDMPEMGGVEATRRLREEYPDIRVLMLTVHEDEDTIFEAVRAGASGYLTKSSTLDELNGALDAIREGGAYMTPVAARKALQCLAK